MQGPVVTIDACIPGGHRLSERRQTHYIQRYIPRPQKKLSMNAHRYNIRSPH
jgi:hypothetical protein